MGQYLSEVIEEYENNVREHRGNASISLSALPKLRAMVIKSKNGSDFRKFSDSYHKALTIIQEERVRVSG
jgi:hypothetical protein